MELNGSQTGKNLDGAFLDAEALKSAFSVCLINVFLKMFTALLVTAFVAFAVVRSQSLLLFVFGTKFTFYGILIAEVGLVIVISAVINKISSLVANILFFFYAALNGLTMASIFFAFSLGTIYLAFGVTALTFAAMAGVGAITRRDLSNVGSICMMGLIGVIIASLLNLFLKSEFLDYVVCYVGVLVFVGLTAYDTQRIKAMLSAAQESNQQETVRKVAVIGALTLYLDFINLFLKILSIMGKRRN